MDKKRIQSNILLLITATIWGFAFSAQRLGAEHLGSLSFNGIRFLLGSCSLLPLITLQMRKNTKNVQSAVQNDKTNDAQNGAQGSKSKAKSILFAGLVCGLCMFFGATLQQLGIESTSAGKAGFITSLYIVLVPIFGLFFNKKPPLSVAFAVVIAVVGFYLLTITDAFTIQKGDILVLIGSVFWACHILVVDYFAKKVSPLVLSALQFAVCGASSLLLALIFEDISLDAIKLALVPILYGGLCSVGIAYTLQVVAQKNAEPTQASLILSLESVFSALGGMIILHETMSAKGLLGCALIFVAIVLAQVPIKPKAKN